jgi:hypothetical protein
MDNYFFIAPGILNHLYFSVYNVAIVVLVSVIVSRIYIFYSRFEAAAPNNTKDEADKTQAKAHPEGNQPT